MRAADPLLAATAFLTRIPVGRAVTVDAAAIGRAAPLYPLVGAAIGAVGGAVVDVTGGALPPLAAATLGLAAATLLTGAIHLDGLADTADALAGADRRHRLEIMRDHAVGSFGATALVLVLLYETVLLAAVEPAWSAFAAAAACARWTPLPLAAALTYARPEGQGAVLERTGAASVVLGLAIATTVALAVRGIDGLAAVAAAAGTAVLLGAFFRRWIGGVTGDTLGAATELAQAAALTALLVA